MTTLDRQTAPVPIDPAAPRTGTEQAETQAEATDPRPGGRRTFSAWLSGLWADPGTRRVTVGWVLLAATLVVYFFLAGIPWSTNWVFIYITAGLIVSSLGSGVRWRHLLRDWLPLFLVLTAYGFLRSYASDTLWSPLVKPQVWFDTHVFGGVAPTVQLQRWIFTPGLHFWDYLVWCCYMTHFFASFIIAGVLWKTDHARFKRFVPLFVGLTFAGYVTYVLYPAMPPWLAAQTGNLPHVTRIVPVVLDHLHFHTGAAIFTGGDKFDNNVAAMPSLHGAYPMLICLFFWKEASTRKRILLAAYPICMAFTLVYTGEHFVIDILMGWLYAAATFYFGSKLLSRWEARQARRKCGNIHVDHPDPSGAVERSSTHQEPAASRVPAVT